MGYHNWPVYGEMDLGSAIEVAEKVIAKIKTNKFDNKDKIALADALLTIKTSIEQDEN